MSLYLLTAMVFTLLYLWRLGLFGHNDVGEQAKQGFRWFWQNDANNVATRIMLQPGESAPEGANVYTAAPKERLGAK